jgi:lysophospholipase L1-like esterase
MKNFALLFALLWASSEMGMANEPMNGCLYANCTQTVEQDTACVLKGYVRHPWFGAKVGYIGDSITDPNCIKDIKKYWAFLEEWLGITPYVYGVSGKQWNDVQRQAEKLKAEHGDDVDAIIVFLGTNDYNSSVPIGEWYIESTEQVMAAHGGKPKKLETHKMRTLQMDESTFKGRINKGLSCLKKMYPDKQIILLTPLHRSAAKFSETNIQPDERYQNSCDEYIDAYVQAVKDASNVWGVPVIDFNAETGMNPMVEEQLSYFHDVNSDRLHPSTKGQERMARTLMYRLLSYPCRF